MPRPATTIQPTLLELKMLKSRRALKSLQQSALASPFESSEPSSSKRRTPSKPYTRRRSRAADSASPQSQCHPFDQLPWISALDEEHDYYSNPWDIADLSQIPEPSFSSSRMAAPVSGPGPVRRRKTSLRSSPFPPSLSSTPSLRATPLSRQSSPCETPSRSRSSVTRPQTPPPRSPFNPSRVLFRHLMPVLSYSDSHRDGSDSEPCTTSGFLPAFQLR